MKKIFILTALKLSCLLLITTTLKAQYLEVDWGTKSMENSLFSLSQNFVDNDQNIYSIGYFSETIFIDDTGTLSPYTSNGSLDMIVEKRTATGELLWAKTFGGADNDYLRAITVSASGYIYLGGSFTGMANFGTADAPQELEAVNGLDGFLMKLNSDGEFQWVKSIGAVGTEQITALAMDGDEYLIIGGVIQETTDMDMGEGVYELDNNRGMFIEKLSIDGDFVWAKEMGSLNTNDVQRDWIYEIEVDDNHDIIFSGAVYEFADMDPSLETNIINLGEFSRLPFIEKLDSEGNFEWVNQMGYLHLSTYDFELGSEGDIIFMGGFIGSFDADPSSNEYLLAAAENIAQFLVSYTPEGELNWGGVLESIDQYMFQDICIDNDDNIYLVGGFRQDVSIAPLNNETVMYLSDNKDPKMLIVKLNNDGSFEWVNDLNPLELGTMKIHCENEDEILLNGTTFGEADFAPGPNNLIKMLHNLLKS